MKDDPYAKSLADRKYRQKIRPSNRQKRQQRRDKAAIQDAFFIMELEGDVGNRRDKPQRKSRRSPR